MPDATDSSSGNIPVPPPRRKRRLRRAALLLVTLVVVVPLLVGLAVFLGLRSQGVREAILGRVSGYLAREYGIAFTAEDFTPVWSLSGVGLRNVKAGAPGAPPLITAERAEVRVDLGSLRRPVFVVRSIEVDAPRLDLTAPFPTIPKKESEAGRGVEVRRIVLRRGVVVGPAPEKPLADWVTAWRVEGLEAEGSFRDEVLDATVAAATAKLERPGFGPQDLQLKGRVRYQEGQPVRFDGVEVAGDGLRVAASGSAGLEEGAPLAVTFDAEAEPRALVAGVPTGGRVQARGNVALPEASGRVALTVEGVPAEVARPYLDTRTFSDVSLAGTVLDARVDATLGPGSLTRAAGDGEAVWRRGGRRLARAEVRVEPVGETEAVRLAFAGDLLPDSAGKRSVRGTLRADGWADLPKAVAEEARAEVRIGDVRAALAEVRALWPRLVPQVPEGVPLQGSLAADVRVTGRLDAPQAVADATWVPEPGSRVLLKAEGRPLARSGSANVRMESLSLALLGGVAPGLSGTASGTVEISGAPRGYRTRADLATAGVAYPPALERLETANLTAEGVLRLDPLVYDGTLSVEGAGLLATGNASGPARVERFRLVADGSLKATPLTYTGKVTAEGTGVDVAGTARVADVDILADGMLRAEPLSYQGTLAVTGSGLEAPETAGVDRFELAADGAFALEPRSLSGDVRLTADRIVLPAAETEVRDVRLTAEGDGREVRISSLSGSLPAGRSFAGSGRALLEPLLAEADLDLTLVRPVDAVPSVRMTATLRGGVVELSAPGVETATGPVSLRARVPLGALRQVPQLAGKLEGLPLTFTPGPVSVSLQAAEVDSERLLPALGLEPRAEKVRGAVTADLTFEPGAPAAGWGEIRIEGLTAETPEARVVAEGPVTLRLGSGRLEVPPVRLLVAGAGVEGAGVDVRATADLDPAWSPFEDPLKSVLTRMNAQGGGTIDASLLNPFLQGGAASGSLTFAATASGPLDALVADVEASGPGASFFWPTPYATRVQDPRIAASLRDGRLTIREGTLRLNGGTVELAGGRSPEGVIDLEAAFSGVRYRVDYGLLAQVSGRVDFRMPPEGRARLEGQVTVERGVLDRDLNLDREVIDLLLQPEDTPGTEATFLDTIDLALRVDTVDGVRIRNNVGDLRAYWEPLSISGTVENPVIRGRIEVDPGGLFYAYGQTLRIDRGSIQFTGDPLTDPRLDLATTSSLQDPTIANLRGVGDGLLAELERQAPEGDGEESALDVQAAVAAGLSGFYGARVLSAFGQSLGLRGFSVQPVLVLNEADPSARLTVGRDLSPNVFFALSVDLRRTEDQRFLIDLHGFRNLPRLSAQAFTTDEGQEGGSVQQVLEFGGTPVAEEAGSRLRRLRLDVPEGLSARRLRRALGRDKGEIVPAGAAFDIEVELADVLRRQGYPDPRLTVAVTPVESRPGWVDVNVRVEPGPRVEFVFAGDRPPRGSRPEITTLYRPDFYEPNSLQEMETTAERIFRSLGHLDPEVAVTVERGRPEDPDGPRTVTITSTPGPKVRIDEVAVPALPAADARIVAARFPGTLSRVELAAGLPDADRRALDALRTLGWPDARITGHRFERRRLVLGVEPGERQALGEIDLMGLDDGERRRLLDLLAKQSVRSGEPARYDRIGQGAVLVEADLRGRGFPDAVVRPVLTPRPDGSQRVDVLYQVEPGSRYQVAAVDFTGGRFSREPLLERVAGLPVGEELDLAEVDAARSRLFHTGVFSRVTTEVDRAEDGTAQVSFSLTEKPRFRFGYGVRTESGVGTGAIVDLVDGNFLGRAMTLGLRGLYRPDDRLGRLSLETGGLLGTAISLQAYGLVRRQLRDEGFIEDDLIEDNRVEDTEELALQLQRPFGRRVTGRLYGRYRIFESFLREPDPFDPFAGGTRISYPLLGTQLLYDTRNDRLAPTRGLFASLDLSGSGPWMGSDFDFARTFGQASLYKDLELAGRPLLWAQALRVGYLKAFGGQEIIEDELFFTGGEFSVRGYDTESLGLDILDSLRAPDEELLLVINQELRVPLPFFDLTGLVFFDAGQVWDDPGDFGTRLAKSLGIGLRASTPLGLLRFDAAYPLDRRPGDDEYKLYLGFGNTF